MGPLAASFTHKGGPSAPANVQFKSCHCWGAARRCRREDGAILGPGCGHDLRKLYTAVVHGGKLHPEFPGYVLQDQSHHSSARLRILVTGEGNASRGFDQSATYSALARQSFRTL